MAEIVVVHGQPGSGRTTQCRRTAEEGLDGRPVRHVSVGDQLEAIRSRKIASTFSDYILAADTPAHLPDDIVNGVVFEALGAPSANELLLIDGYPRYSQALPIFRKSIEANNLSLLGVISFEATLDACIARALARERRIDDVTSDLALESETTFQYNRYFQTTRIALMGLQSFTTIETVIADGDKDAVHAEFVKALGRLACHE